MDNSEKCYHISTITRRVGAMVLRKVARESRDGEREEVGEIWHAKII
jgi:hypothetical protein